MTTETKLTTAEELLRMPADGRRRELIHGEVKTMAPAGHQHGRIAQRIALSLGQHVSVHKLGEVYAAETGFKLASNPDHVRAPDAAFVRRERVSAVGDAEGFWPGAPDLAVEVVSPSDSFADVEEKVFDWLDAGTRAVVVVNPKKRSVTLYRSVSEVRILSETESLSVEDVVPGWNLPVRELFTR
ncbi:MAG: Uma2 family endonuclease [Nitrososphaera sp.]